MGPFVNSRPPPCACLRLTAVIFAASMSEELGAHNLLVRACTCGRECISPAAWSVRGLELSYDALTQCADALWTPIQGQNCVAWVGSGLSRCAGYPDWPQTISALCEACGVERLAEGDPDSDEWTSLALDKSERCKTANHADYCATLGRLFGRTVVTSRRAYDLLVALPFKGFITTNFDPLLADAAARRGHSNLWAYPGLLPAPALGGDARPVFYIHGIATDANGRACGTDLVLSRREFETAYSHSESPLPSFLEQVLTLYPVIFFGCALSEPGLREVFRRSSSILARIGNCRPSRLMLTPERNLIIRAHSPDAKAEIGDGITRGRDSGRLAELQIKPVFYCASDEEQHCEIEQVLEQLCDRAQVPIRPIRMESFLGGATP